MHSVRRSRAFSSSGVENVMCLALPMRAPGARITMGTTAAALPLSLMGVTIASVRSSMNLSVAASEAGTSPMGWSGFGPSGGPGGDPNVISDGSMRTPAPASRESMEAPMCLVNCSSSRSTGSTARQGEVASTHRRGWERQMRTTSAEESASGSVVMVRFSPSPRSMT